MPERIRPRPPQPQPQPQPRPQPRPRPQPQPVNLPGRAYEIHISYDKINTKKLIEIIKPIVKNPDTFYKRMSWPVLINEYIRNKFLNLIQTTNNEDISRVRTNEPKNLIVGREDFTHTLNILFNKIAAINNNISDKFENERNKVIFGNCVDYMFKKNDEVAGLYVQHFISECANAYKPEKATGETESAFKARVNREMQDMSFYRTKYLTCVNGFFERFVTTIGYVIQILCMVPGNPLCKEEYTIIFEKAFIPLDKNEISQEWDRLHFSNDEYLDQLICDGIKYSEATQDQKNECLRKDYIAFGEKMFRDRGVAVTEFHTTLLTNEANQLQEIFTRGYFGGKRKRSITKKRKPYKKHFTRKNKKINKKINKSKNH